MISEETISLLDKHITAFREKGRRIFASSSFQTQSIPLLHIIGKHFTDVQVIFIDTGFLFAETYAFKEQLKKAFNINVLDLRPKVSLSQQLDSSGLFQYSLNPDYCCHINKVLPIQDFLQPGDVWISGVRKDQTSNRRQMQVLEESKNKVLRFHPMLEWTAKDVYDYIRINQLPKHPLDGAGFVSIGCVPCTHSWSGQLERGGRWVGSQKTECGLHTELRNK